MHFNFGNLFGFLNREVKHPITYSEEIKPAIEKWLSTYFRDMSFRDLLKLFEAAEISHIICFDAGIDLFYCTNKQGNTFEVQLLANGSSKMLSITSRTASGSSNARYLIDGWHLNLFTVFNVRKGNGRELHSLYTQDRLRFKLILNSLERFRIRVNNGHMEKNFSLVALSDEIEEFILNLPQKAFDEPDYLSIMSKLTFSQEEIKACYRILISFYEKGGVKSYEKSRVHIVSGKMLESVFKVNGNVYSVYEDGCCSFSDNHTYRRTKKSIIHEGEKLIDIPNQEIMKRIIKEITPKM